MTVEKLQIELRLVEQRIAFFQRERERYVELLEKECSKIPVGSNARVDIPKPNKWMKGPTKDDKDWLMKMRVKW